MPWIWYLLDISIITCRQSGVNWYWWTASRQWWTCNMDGIIYIWRKSISPRVVYQMVRKRLQVVIICIYEITGQVSCQDQVTNQDEVINTTFDPNMNPALLWFYDVIEWKHFSRYLPFVWGIQRSPVNPITKAMTRKFDVFLICAWTNSRGNTGDTGDLRRLRAHYDVMVMSLALRLSHLPESNSEEYGKINHINSPVSQIPQCIRQTIPQCTTL